MNQELFLLHTQGWVVFCVVMRWREEEEEEAINCSALGTRAPFGWMAAAVHQESAAATKREERKKERNEPEPFNLH